MISVICMCVHSLVSINVTSGSKMFKDLFFFYNQPCFMDSHLIRTPHCYGHFALSLGKKALAFFSKLNLCNMDTLLILTFSMVPSVSVLISMHATKIQVQNNNSWIDQYKLFVVRAGNNLNISINRDVY